MLLLQHIWTIKQAILKYFNFPSNIAFELTKQHISIILVTQQVQINLLISNVYEGIMLFNMLTEKSMNHTHPAIHKIDNRGQYLDYSN